MLLCEVKSTKQTKTKKKKSCGKVEKYTYVFFFLKLLKSIKILFDQCESPRRLRVLNLSTT